MHVHKDPPSKAVRFLTGNGFYLALAVCLLAVGAVAVATFANRLNAALPEEPTPTAAANRTVTGVPKTTVTETTTTVTATTTAVTTTAPAQRVNQTTAAKPLYVLPLSNVVSRGYSAKPVWNETLQEFRLHTGTDFAGEAGDKVMAVADGTVTAVKQDSLWGGMIVVDHGCGLSSVYCGVTASVEKGAHVKAGQTVGTLSSVPCERADGAHLHLELCSGGEPIDPVAALGQEVITK